ncbi:bifunctional heptose 7-phosphate kinase/heptose 1-phosphate adenyltransferase [Leucobacter sp. CSA1]|uniref:Bifunctional heptose 7-phosphate kinase/heptose 1-phosphate adenyltransferase n=1 Tax=Leucobacter chromiisoli TaxID=2796471 RepID=A0A934Q920_9MICO|nr:PfkB family carbohydrate kinase [Leucobacter chromiisoli]MBK0419728.1 bifunctional heptose 7-phosphate kinase/heptose 1-phosphate adenyltransferase [Leucobacter chromiisoli]
MKLVVVGDVLLDRDVTGTSERLSPEAPVPVVDVAYTRRRAGGAGLVATMLAAEADVSLVTVLSDDESSDELRSALRGVSVVAGPSGAPTPVKTRVGVAGHPIVRIDEGCAPAPVPEATEAMLAEIEGADVIMVADYGRGLTRNEPVREALRERGRTVPIVWDPHPRGAPPVETSSVVTPNLFEAAAAAGVPASFESAFEAGRILRERWGCAAVAVTVGERGVVVAREEEALPVHVSAPAVGNVDSCGAGDRFAASVALALGGGEDLSAAVTHAVDATSRFLGAGGVASLDTEVVPLRTRVADAFRVARDTRARGGTVVATGGCFDLLHAGHARTLAAARELGDCLIVCLNSDDSVRRLKGPERPIMTQADREDLLTSLACVDGVLVFDEDTPDTVLRRLQPDVWVKGGDYSAAALPEAETVAEWGGRTVTVPYHPGRSTTRLASAIERVG